jgi:tRNA1Val (adenine37-N6)-methyltransferase
VPGRADRTTRDAIFGGRVALVQPGRDCGYRVNVDAILLGEFAAAAKKHVRSAFDLGAGVGAVGLSLLHLGAAERVTLIEIDPGLAALAEQNAQENAWSERVSVVVGDVRASARSLAGAAELVVCNPPYVAPGRGRPPSPARARAKSGDLGTFLDAARTLAGRRARVCFVYPAIEATTLLVELRARGLEPKRMRFVHAKASAPARVVLVECAAGKPGGLLVEPPLFA